MRNAGTGVPGTMHLCSFEFSRQNSNSGGTGVPETGVPETGVPETGVPETGVPGTGVPVDWGPG